MSARIEHQVINGPDGNPAFAVIPWEAFEEAFEQGRPDDEVFIPHEVVVLHIEGGMSLIRAWREHLGLSQREIATRMGMTQPSYAKMEAKGANPRQTTLKKIAAAMGVEWEQLKN